MKHVVIFCRRPQLGQVKTRLARDIGAAAATGFYRHNLDRLIRRLGADDRWQLSLAVTPDQELAQFDHSVPSAATIRRFPQGQGNLGHRMMHCSAVMPTGPLLIVGSDIPDITSAHIASAFRVLQSCDSVIGPSPDGGYWLIGWSAAARRRPIDLSHVRWSTASARDDTIAALEQQGLSVGLTNQLNDIDSGEDYLAWRGL